MDAVQALDDDALQLVESSIIPNLKAWGCVQLRFVCVCVHPSAQPHQRAPQAPR